MSKRITEMAEAAVCIIPIYLPFVKTFRKPQKGPMFALGTSAEDTTWRLNPLPTALEEERNPCWKQQGTLTCPVPYHIAQPHTLLNRL